MRLSEATRDFLQHMEHGVGHTYRTVVSYRSKCKLFAGWLKDQGFDDPPVDEITETMIRRHIYAQSTRKLRPRTIRCSLCAIRSLFRYLVEEGAVAENPAEKVAMPKKDAAQRRLVDSETLEKLMEATQRQHSDFRCLRDGALLGVLVYCALRRQEVLDLKVSDVNVADKSLIVQQGKGRKQRLVSLCPEVLAALREWLPVRERQGCKHDYLFTTEWRRRVGQNTLAKILEQIKAIAGLKNDPRIKPHSIRHACATRIHHNGADVVSIQKFLGHSDPKTTLIYLHTDDDRVRSIAHLASFRPNTENWEDPTRQVHGQESQKGEARRQFFQRRREVPRDR
jgi:site-specific recombinase XerD